VSFFPRLTCRKKQSAVKAHEQIDWVCLR